MSVRQVCLKEEKSGQLLINNIKKPACMLAGRETTSCSRHFKHEP